MSAPLATALLPLAMLAPAASPVSAVEADFDPATAFVPPAAISYASDLVPYGSHAAVFTDRSTAERTVVTLRVAGLAPGHEFPVHMHTGSCGADPAASGPHYQNVLDPVQPSTDPAYANDRNELRLVLHTDGRGDGTASATVAWQPRPGEARSLVLHAGTPAGRHAAGERVACVKLEQ
ncbi:superoxide dismutase family protein [Streptomyces kaniharaensis]|uniref:Superoxide dismutase family protein n=1 Tax=Streptomyces kaniharaensis TaxID=212423 RepID=A0A6N7KQ31_9ACTN|nr:superoxide dismutase family protein [Streptomyces kaniharaensis]MQS12244.1 superoxide dismutase family protein [Streptomyces kaniharaensis]